MSSKKDLRKLGVAAMAVALAGCQGIRDGSSVGGSGAGITDLPPECMPVGGDPDPKPDDPVLFRGAVPKKKPDMGAGGGTTTVPAVGLGAPTLQPGVGPETAGACGTASAKLPGTPGGPAVQRDCYFVGTDPTVQATIERVLESVDDKDLIHVRLTFNPHFVDNSYGTTAIGWLDSKKGTHTYADLLGSDHAELLFTNKQGDVALHVKLDYISEDPSQPSGFGTLGVLGGEGAMLAGDASQVRAVTTSLARNLNGCGYGTYVESSPASDQAFSPSSSAPNWDYRVVYELWIAAEAFGDSGFGGASIEYVHASPSKIGNNTLTVDPGPCPPDVTPPPVVCPPGSVPRDPTTPPPPASKPDAGTPPDPDLF